MPEDHSIQVLVSELRDQRKRHDVAMGELRQDLKGLATSVVEYTTVLRRHIAEQERTGRQLDRLIEDHERRIRGVEEWQTDAAAKMPAWIEDAAELKSELADLGNEVGVIKGQITRWGGVLAAGLLILQFIVTPVAQELVKGWMRPAAEAKAQPGD